MFVMCVATTVLWRGACFINAVSTRQELGETEGDTTMKTLNTFVLALSAVAVLGTAALHAQTGIVANVPFDFTVQAVKMPAGQYALKPLSAASGLIQILNRETGRAVAVLASSTLSTYKGKDVESGKVIFHRYGDRYFFSEVWTPSGLRGRAMPSKLEREVQASSAERQIAAVSISLAGSER
jgi:hypothetical protein